MHTQVTTQHMTTTLRHDPTTDEWIIRVRIDGKRAPEMDYFAADKADAKATEARMHADFLTLHPPLPLTVAIEGEITAALFDLLGFAARRYTIDAAADFLRQRVPHMFIYRGGSHVAIHADRTSPRLALITE
jgi:hypothetical protein